MKYVPPINGDIEDENRPWINANPGVGIRGSIVNAKAIENVQREILAVITGAGIAPLDADLDQLKEAITAMIAASGGSYASDAEAFAGIISNKAVVPSNFTKSDGTSGYYRFPGGLIVQWGSGSTNSSGTASVTFPIAFPNNCRFVIPTRVGLTSSTANSLNPGNVKTNSGCNFWYQQPSSINFEYMAIGN